MNEPGTPCLHSKARLFDQLMALEPHISDALASLARDKALALMTLHESGLRPGGRGYGPADFGLDDISAAVEILTGEPLDVDGLLRDAREGIEARASGECEKDGAAGLPI